METNLTPQSLLNEAIIHYLKSQSGPEVSELAEKLARVLPQPPSSSSANGRPIDLVALVNEYTKSHPELLREDATVDDDDREKKFETYKKLLESRGYFKNCKVRLRSKFTIAKKSTVAS